MKQCRKGSWDAANVQAFVEYFQKGCKQGCQGMLGMEVEHFVVRREDWSAVSYYGERGIEALLYRLAEHFPQKEVCDGRLIGFGCEQYLLSIEPAAQLEISLAPQKTIGALKNSYEQFLALLRPVLAEWDYELVTAGYSPSDCAGQLDLIPKKRYEYMDAYFGKIGQFGKYMMRATASVQIAVDYCSEEEFVHTYRAAVAMGALLALVSDNAPMFEGRAYKGHMLRAAIWEQVDPARCVLVPGMFEQAFGFEQYARWLYEVPAIFAQGENGEHFTTQSLRILCANRPMTARELEHAVSIVFPDVRLKQYMEIRVGDSMPQLYAFAYAAFVKGLFADRQKLFELYKQMEQYTQFGQIREADVWEGRRELMKHGYRGRIFGRSASYWLKRMGTLAQEMLVTEEARYFEPMKQLIAEQKSVRDVTITQQKGGAMYA